jgi:hypothetical protein
MVSFEDDEEGSYLHIGDVDPKETLGSDYDYDDEEATTENRTVSGSSRMVNLEDDEEVSSYLHIKNVDPTETLYDYDVEEATAEHLRTISGSSRMVILTTKERSVRWSRLKLEMMPRLVHSTRQSLRMNQNQRLIYAPNQLTMMTGLLTLSLSVKSEIL